MNVSVAAASVSEGDDGTPKLGFTITATRDAQDSVGAVTIQVGYAALATTTPPSGTDVAKAGATCGSGVDFLDKSYPNVAITLAAGDMEQQQAADVELCADNADEKDEAFTLQLNKPADQTWTMGSPQQVHGTITNDDDPTITAKDVSIEEPAAGKTGNAAFDVVLSNRSNEPISLKYDTQDGTATAPDDYVDTSGTLSFSGTEVKKTVSVPVKGDSHDEPDETFTLALTDVVGTTGTVTNGTATIRNGDDPTLLVDSPRHAEGSEAQHEAGEDNAMTFTISLTHETADDVTFSYKTVVDPAGAGEQDFVHTEGGGIIEGNDTFPVEVPLIGDDAKEGDETFTLEIFDITNATNTTAKGTGTIADDDGTTPALSIDDIEVLEGAEGQSTDAVFTVTVSKPTQQEISVDYATSDGTATKDTDDYVPTAGTLKIPPGGLEGEIAVPINGDEFPGPNEHFFLNLSNAQNAVIIDNQGKALILNDDGAVIEIADTTAEEPDDGENGTATFEVELSEPNPDDPVIFKYQTVDGTALAGEDYTAESGTVTIDAGDDEAEIVIETLGDAVAEGDETFTLSLTDAANATLRRSSVTATLREEGSTTPTDETSSTGVAPSAGAARAMDDSCPDGSVPEDGYTDTDGSAHESAVDCLVWWGITTGKSDGTYAPIENVSRAQMASFVARTLTAAGVQLPAEPANAFTDDEGSTHELAINQLSELGVVRGKGEGIYAPQETVRRDQMASFLVAAHEAVTGQRLAGSGDSFTDDDGNVHESNINAVASVGIAAGKSAGTYDPGSGVKRDQMASFLMRLMDLLVEEGHASPPS